MMKKWINIASLASVVLLMGCAALADETTPKTGEQSKVECASVADGKSNDTGVDVGNTDGTKDTKKAGDLSTP